MSRMKVTYSMLDSQDKITYMSMVNKEIRVAERMQKVDKRLKRSWLHVLTLGYSIVIPFLQIWYMMLWLQPAQYVRIKSFASKIKKKYGVPEVDWDTFPGVRHLFIPDRK